MLQAAETLVLALVPALALPLLLASCAAVPGESPRDRIAAPVLVEADGVVVYVENRRMERLRIFVVGGGSRTLLGDVGPRERKSFVLPRVVPTGDGRLRLLAEAYASTVTVRSGSIALGDGHRVEWLVRRAGSRLRIR